MAGISSYEDGETGIVTRVEWNSDNRLCCYVHMKDNPNRTYALDYDSDIRVDASLEPGDRIVYKRLDAYCGFWFKEGETGRYEQVAEKRRAIRRRKYREVCLRPVLLSELAIVALLGAIVTFAFFLIRHKPGEVFDALLIATFAAIYFSLIMSGLFQLFLKYPTMSDLKDRGFRLVWDTLKMLGMEILYVLFGILVVIIVLGLTVGLVLKLVSPGTLDAMDAFIRRGNNICYIFCGGFLIWALVHVRDMWLMIREYPPEECS